MFKKIFHLVVDTFKEWNEDKATRLGAALSYYTIFSIGPLLVIVVAIASLVFGEQAARGQIMSTIGGLVGSSGAKGIEDAMNNANKGGGSIIATIIGIVTLLFGAAGVFGQLKDSLNTIWEVQPKPNAGIMNMLRQRFLSFTMLLGTGFLLLVSLVVSAALAALSKFMSALLPGADVIWQIVSVIITILVIALLFAMLFKFLPDIEIKWSDVAIGSLVTAVLFTLGQFVLGLYLGSGSVGSTWGAAGSVVIVLVWIYYSSLIFFMGAEFTQVYTNEYGSRVKPKPYAEMLTEEQRAEQGMPHKEDTSDRAREQREGKEGKGGREKSGGRERPGLKSSPWFS